MIYCIFTRFVRYCFPLNIGKGLQFFFTQNHGGIDHHGTDLALTIHANSPLFFSFFSMSSPKRSLQTSKSPLKTLRETGNCPYPNSSRLSCRLWEAGRARGWTSSPGISSVRQNAVDCGRMQKRFTGADSPKLEGKSTGLSLETSWRRPSSWHTVSIPAVRPMFGMA